VRQTTTNNDITRNLDFQQTQDVVAFVSNQTLSETLVLKRGGKMWLSVVGDPNHQQTVCQWVMFFKHQ
jgi:hypothetical protein